MSKKEHEFLLVLGRTFKNLKFTDDIDLLEEDRD